MATMAKLFAMGLWWSPSVDVQSQKVNQTPEVARVVSEIVRLVLFFKRPLSSISIFLSLMNQNGTQNINELLNFDQG